MIRVRNPFIIEHIFQGPDVLVQSPTGSGKTAAFGIPAVQIASEYKG